MLETLTVSRHVQGRIDDKYHTEIEQWTISVTALFCNLFYCRLFYYSCHYCIFYFVLINRDMANTGYILWSARCSVGVAMYMVFQNRYVKN